MRRLNLAGQRCPKGHHPAVELARGVLVLLDDGARQTDAREYAASARIRQNLRSHLPVRIRRRMATDGPRGHGCVRPQLELARQKFFGAVLVHDQHDQIDSLPADLEADASPAGEQKRGCAPTFLSPATGHAAAIVGRHDESALQQRGNDRDAFCRTQHFFRNARVRSRLDLVQHHGRSLDPVFRLAGVFLLVFAESQCGKRECKQKHDRLFHHPSAFFGKLVNG